MGILDEAIREHLELKRQHGAEESELKGLEDEAFGPADRPDATGPADAKTQIISPGAGSSPVATEGDQLDKVFEQTRQAKQAEAEQVGEESAVEPEATFAEHPIPDPPAPASGPAQPEAATVESPEAKPVEPEPESAAEPASPAPEDAGDAGDLLEAERQHLSSHPTEHYDVDAAIAEEDEIDILSESSLSDELDRALETNEPAGEDSADLLYEDAAAENQPVEQEEPTGEDEAVEEDEPAGEDEAVEEEGSSDFFDQDDVLEATPDFLEETPEHDQLWFEQKEPKDFDFGD
ncbi:MAG: hypothetical protein IT199_02195 [Solirubrobacterales bacterium]|nr:hypothetical protein [Solirubrobacterales bacterium]